MCYGFVFDAHTEDYARASAIGRKGTRYCTCNYWDPAFPRLIFHENAQGPTIICLGGHSWRTVSCVYVSLYAAVATINTRFLCSLLFVFLSRIWRLSHVGIDLVNQSINQSEEDKSDQSNECYRETTISQRIVRFYSSIEQGLYFLLWPNFVL